MASSRYGYGKSLTIEELLLKNLSEIDTFQIDRY